MEATMKRIIAILVALALVAGAVGTVGAQTKSATKKLTIAQTVIDLSNSYFVTLSEGVRAACKEKGFTYILNDGKSDASLQISAIENFIVQQVDVIIVTPVDPKALDTVLKEAKKAGIVIINCNQEVATKDAFLRVPEYSYGYAAGKMAADWINATIKGRNAKVAVLNRPVSEQLVQRSEGFKKGVTENSKATIVAVQTANTAELGLKAAETILQNFPDIDGFVCQNDTAGLGVYEALIAAGRKPGSAFITSVDGLPKAFEKIAEGGIYVGTVDSNPRGMGALAVETALKVIQSGPIAKEINPSIVPVTKANVASYLKR